MKNKRIHLTLMLIMLTTLIGACGRNSYTPKPVGYIRFDLPEKNYETYDDARLPFTFEKASEAEVVWKKEDRRHRWLDINYPQYHGVVYLTYNAMRGSEDLKGQIDTSYRLMKIHFDYSSGLDEQQFFNEPDHVYGSTYLIKGQNVASTYQFWLTDSTRHFLHGALFIDCTPNNDSLAPILEYLQSDIQHLIETVKWK